MSRKITTLGGLGALLEKQGERLEQHIAESTAFHRETRESFRSIGDHLVRIEARLEEVPTRGELGEMMARIYDAAAMEAKLETIRRNIREKLHVEV